MSIVVCADSISAMYASTDVSGEKKGVTVHVVEHSLGSNCVV